MNPLERLEKEFPNLTRSEQAITEYILKNPMTVIRYSLTQIAMEARTSNTAVIRLCQKLGYQGFPNLSFLGQEPLFPTQRKTTVRRRMRGRIPCRPSYLSM